MLAFTVKGRGRFPVDMLRYDRACPQTSADSRKIEDSVRNRGYNGYTITLVTERKSVTVDRWASFGWSVTV